MEFATLGGFSPTAAAMQKQGCFPSGLCCGGAFHSVREWAVAVRSGCHRQGICTRPHGGVAASLDCPAFLLVAGGSSILAGDPPKETAGWSCGLGAEDAPKRLFLTDASLSGSGLAVKGNHIFDPRTGRPALRQKPCLGPGHYSG